jgi:hypothetical protein
MKQDALRRQQETEEEARQKFILDSLRALEMYNDSVLNAKRIADSIAQAEAARIADSIRIADSLAALKGNINWDSLRHVRDSLKHIQDSLDALEKARADSLARIADSLAALEKARQDSLEKKRIQDSIRAADQIPPNAEIVPPAGRYYDPIKLKVKCDEIKCKTYLSIGDTLHPIDASKAMDSIRLAAYSSRPRTPSATAPSGKKPSTTWPRTTSAARTPTPCPLVVRPSA